MRVAIAGKIWKSWKLYGFLSRRFPLDESLQRVVLKSLRSRILYLSHYSRLAGHPGSTRLYYTLRRKYYWPHMVNYVYATVRGCLSCTRTRGTTFKHHKPLKLFLAAGPMEFLAMGILGFLPKTVHGNVYVLVITDRF